MTNYIKLDSDFAWRVVLFMCFAILIFSNAEVALASAQEADPIGDKLCKLVDSLSGSIAKSIATIAIIGVAGGLLLGKLNWVVAMTVSTGVIIIFSAGKIVKWISGEDGVSGNCGS